MEQEPDDQDEVFADSEKPPRVLEAEDELQDPLAESTLTGFPASAANEDLEDEGNSGFM